MTMLPRTTRPRSSNSTSTNHRIIKSRASTASSDSTTTRPLHKYRHASESLLSMPTQNGQAQSASYTPEEMITRSEQQLVNPHRNFTIDPSLQDPISHGRALSVDFVFSGNPAIRPALSQYNSYEGKENQALESLNEEQPQDDGTGEGKKKKGSASSLANDMELRRLFRENQGRSLKDVAGQVLANERGPKSEKTKQIFAMLWLRAVCQKSNSSVPRNRVFSHYATRCGTERVPPLNPASFGKLVRIIFPGIQTRRLGMRGESKYHYVDLSLIEDPRGVGSEERTSVGIESNVGMERPSLQRQRSQIPADSAVFPSPDIPIPSNSFGPTLHRPGTVGSLYLDPLSKSILKGPSYANMVQRKLKFPAEEEGSYHEDEPFHLPSIQEFLPVGTDVDAADALTALYRSHCISVIDCFRFCKEKMLWHHFTSFHGTLTVPVQKLLAHPNIAPWIKECDWLMYQKMIRFVAPLALQVVPIRVIDTFRAISTKLGPHISLTFQNHPPCVQDSKLGPATIFASLLDRLLRVNATAHAAANMLTNDANRDQMWHDWVVHVKPIRVVESSLPGCGYTRVLEILTAEIRNLLGPLRMTSHVGMNSAFMDIETNAASTTLHHIHPELDDNSTEGVLDRWTNFLQTLPQRFPGADARLLLHCVSEVGSAALRDITMAQAVSFGSWWVTKVWVDEMLQWLAEKGGFMEESPQSMELRGKVAFSPDPEFPMDEASETFMESRPRTAASHSVDVLSRPQSLDPSRIGHSRQSPPASVLSQIMRGTSSIQTADFVIEPHHGSHEMQVVNTSKPLTSNEKQSERVQGLNISHPPLHHEELQFGSNTHLTRGSHLSLALENVSQQHTHDDSGIGMGLEEDDELTLAKYSGFIAGSVNDGSDPADVVVC